MIENQTNEIKNIHLRVKDGLKACIDFWLKNGQDKINGGIYTCLDRA